MNNKRNKIISFSIILIILIGITMIINSCVTSCVKHKNLVYKVVMLEPYLSIHISYNQRWLSRHDSFSDITIVIKNLQRSDIIYNIYTGANQKDLLIGGILSKKSSEKFQNKYFQKCFLYIVIQDSSGKTLKTLKYDIRR